MSEPEDEKDKIRQLLKSQATLTPPESFYQGVRQRIAAGKSSRPNFLFSWPMKLMATACAVTVVVIASRDAFQSKEVRPEIGSRIVHDFQNVELKEENRLAEKKSELASIPRDEAESRKSDSSKRPASAPLARQRVGGTLSQRGIRPADIEFSLEGAADKSAYPARKMETREFNQVGVAGLQSAPSAPASESELNSSLQSKSIGSGLKQNLAKKTDRLPVEWRACEKASDCVAVGDPHDCACLCPLYINLKSFQAYDLYRKEHCQSVPPETCTKICPSPAPPACLNQTCTSEGAPPQTPSK